MILQRAVDRSEEILAGLVDTERGEILAQTDGNVAVGQGSLGVFEASAKKASVVVEHAVGVLSGNIR